MDAKDERIFNLQLKEIHDKLGEIKELNEKANGRLHQNEVDLEELRLKGVEHIILCPVKPRVKEIESDLSKYKKEIDSDLSEYRMIKKHPILAALILIVLVFGSVIMDYLGASHNKETFIELMKQEMRDQVGVSKVTRSGWVHFNDQGLSDSVKVK